ncbi:MAG: aminotransferase class V-fold PLP-dependent enzyme [Myxococcales bacterium]|nr:aminotransferase class V-fold PLP-dependent enzyme [Myxococcales bacterium]MBK7196235.1 aminotransferase class V-fold PLP-dependent enzyme [Myxococcales bacterium]MBP6847149.1 aminotransferase class V-fold PLP-dependent enzyme [Kofleriaceae bacterium]
MIYLDNAASTRVDDAVIARMAEVMRADYGNPSAAHPFGAAARRRIATARGQVLAALGDPDGAAGELVWTSGGTEGNALAVLGAARAAGPGAVVVSALEHPAVAASVALLGDGWPVRVAPVTADGVVDVAAAAALIDPATRVLAVMLVSNELGTVQPIAALAAAARARAPGCHVHCDATQALGKVAIDVGALGVDSLGVAGHKLHGPKGSGALWLRHGRALAPLWGGGGQQGGRRPGTQDAPGAAGLGLAAERALAALPEASARWQGFAETLHAAAAASGVPWRSLAPGPRAPHVVSLAFARVSADALREVMASRGVIVSSGSACATPGAKPSGSLAAIGLPATWGMVRLSFGLDTRADEVATAAAILRDVVRDLAGA